MATRLKTIEYWFPELASITDNTDTNFTQITVYIPETVSSFVSVNLDVILQDAATTAADVNRRQVSLQLGATGYTVVNNTNTYTQSGEQKWFQMTGDFTSVFSTNWTGTSMTCDARLLVDSANTTPILRDATAKLTITYNYDDTGTTHVKTVWMPLNAPIASLDASKPASANDTFPALDTWLPEASKTIRQTTIVVQGNEEQSGTTDISLSMQLDAAGASYTSSLHEQALNSSCWFRHSWQPSFTTNATHDFFIWASAATKFAHPQVWMVITYEFNASTSTTIMNSILMPMEFDSPMGGTTSADYQSASRDLFVEEPTTITLERSAILFFWDQAAAIAGLNFRVATGGWNAFTSTAATVCGGMAGMLRAETDLSSLSRGKKTLSAAAYRTDTADLGMNLSSVWMINYTSGKHASGVGVHNHTVFKSIATHSTGAATLVSSISATSFQIPESTYFLNAIGYNYVYLSNSTGTPAGVCIQAERLSGEGGVKWESAYADISHTDPETGVHQCWSTAQSVFKRWPGDYDANNTRLDIETSRRYRAVLANGCTAWHDLSFVITYHSITFTVAGTVSGYTGNGSGITVDVHRSDNVEHILRTTTSAGGTYSLTWYDNTENLCATAVQDSEHLGRSASGLAA
jgi:hypothetical protein